MKVNLRKEDIDILNVLKEVKASSLLNAVTIKDIKLKLDEKNLKFSLQFIKKHIQTFENMGVIREGLLARKNAKTYYVDLEILENFIIKIHEKYNK